MKNVLCLLMLVALAVTGCAKKEEQASSNTPARQLLVQGTEFLKAGDPMKAVNNFAMAIKESPDDFEGYYLLSETLLRLKQFPQAESFLIATVKRFPDNGVAYYLLAVAHEGTGNLVPAIMAVRKSVDLFVAKKDKEGAERATVLLGALVSAAKKQSEAKAVDNASSEANAVMAQKAVNP
jgi:Flp pilus assembly protein TadD